MSLCRIHSLSMVLVALAALLVAAGCGGSSGSESQTATGAASEAQTGTMTLPSPSGAAAQSCGNTTVKGTSQLRVTGVGCATGRGVVADWTGNASCSDNVSRPSCAVYHGYRCISARTSAGIAVTCARSGESVSFIAKRG